MSLRCLLCCCCFDSEEGSHVGTRSNRIDDATVSATVRVASEAMWGPPPRRIWTPPPSTSSFVVEDRRHSLAESLGSLGASSRTSISVPVTTPPPLANSSRELPLSGSTQSSFASLHPSTLDPTSTSQGPLPISSYEPGTLLGIPRSTWSHQGSFVSANPPTPDFIRTPRVALLPESHLAPVVSLTVPQLPRPHSSFFLNPGEISSRSAWSDRDV